MPEIVNRSEVVGLGIEASYGTKASTIVTVKYDSFAGAPQSEYITDESSDGSRMKGIDSAVVRTYSNPSLSLKLRPNIAGYLFKAIFGQLATTADTPEAGTYTHVASPVSTSTPVSLTLITQSDHGTQGYYGCVVNTATFSFVQNDYVSVELELIGKPPVITTWTPVAEIERAFVGADAQVKLADTVANLPAQLTTCLKSLDIEINNNVDIDSFFCLGSTDFSEAIYGSTEVMVTLTRNMPSLDYQNYHLDGTKRAVGVYLTDADVTIGTSTNPSIEFIFPPSSVETWDYSNGLDDVREETLGFKALVDATLGYNVQSTVVNDVSSY